MILEIDLSILTKIDNITLDQLVLLNLVLNENQNNHQEIQKLFSLVGEKDIQDLFSNGLLEVVETTTSTTYKASEKLLSIVKENTTAFEELYELFPVYVIRPDGTKGFLRSNINKCRKEYNKKIGRSKALHNHIMDCLRLEISNKMSTGKMSYFKTMWKWITQEEWEVIEEQLKDETPSLESKETKRYGEQLY